MRTPKVSVIIPCFNMENFLQECLDSVLQQTLSDIEIICVDDGSTDSTPHLLENYRQQDARVRVFRQSNQGVAVSRNNGIHYATGEFVAFMDPDDFYPNNGTLELLYTKASEHAALICGGSFSSYNQMTGKVSTYYTGDFLKYTFTKEGFISYRDYQFDFGYHRFLYNRAFLLENNLLFPLYTRFQDPPFFVKAMITAQSFYAVPDVVYRYRCCFQDKPTTWPRAKLHDMMRGHLDNLLLSSQEKLSDLHALTVRRFEANNVVDPVMQSLRKGDPQTLNLLIQISAAIDTGLLQQAGMAVSDPNGFLLKEFDALLKEYAAKDPSQSQRCSRFGRLLRGALQCCKDHGFFYTVRLFFIKLKSK